MDTNANMQNKMAWDSMVNEQAEWTIPVTEDIIRKAKKGRYEVRLTGFKPVPSDWLGDVRGKSILCLASAGSPALSFC